MPDDDPALVRELLLLGLFDTVRLLFTLQPSEPQRRLALKMLLEARAQDPATFDTLSQYWHAFRTDTEALGAKVGP